ncbi:MAG TPA: PucR family transcriptional regulator ligand-binding domain-containing protein [Bacillales bacterium]|nr:PucR family transcriptional regulator ligand-binding domain-containing protein [Bacillales bacterium]
MGITVEEALQMPELKETKLVAGFQGIGQEIKWVTILEIIEDVARIHEGEFLITTGYGLNNIPENSGKIIERLARQNLSGVAVHTGYYVKEIPRPMIEAANKLHLPLIEIPKQMTFSAVTRVILEKVVNSQMKLVSYAHHIQEELTSLVLQNYGMSTITRKLAKMTDSRMKIMNKIGEEIDCFPWSGNQSDTKKTPLYQFHYPILVDEQLYGFLHAEKATPFSQFEELAMRQASTIYAIEFLKLKIVDDTKMYLQGDFLDDLLQKGYVNEESAIERGHQLGFELTKQNLVILIQSNDLDRTVNIAIEVFNKNDEKYLLRKKSDHIVVLYLSETETDAETQIKQLGEEIIYRYKKNNQGNASIVIGAGTTVHGVAAISESARQARYALLFSRYMKKEWISFHDLGAYQYFIQLKDNGADLTPYYTSVLGPLIDYDKNHHSNLIKTFEAYIENNLKLQSTADQLFIHRHTLSYRLEQIKKKTGKNIQLANERIQLHLAVMAYRIDQMLSWE